MADQTIALQARAPQGNSMAAAIRQNSQLMNMMTQQAAAQRQSAVAEKQTQQAQQAMEIAQAVEDRVVAAEPGRLQGAALERLGKASETFRNALPGVTFGDVARTTAVRAEVVRMSPELDALLPSVEQLTTNRATYDRAYMTADILANKLFATAQASTLINPKTDAVTSINTAGMPGYSFSQTTPDISESIPQSPAPQAMGGVPPQAMGSNSTARPSRGANTAPQDLLGQGVNPNSIPSGYPLRPMSMTTGGDQAAQQDLAAIAQTMMQTGVISQAGLDAMRAAAPGKDDQLAQILRENNIQILPNEGEAPGMSNAVFRPGMDAMPQRQDVQYAPSQYPRTYGRDPLQAPTQVPASAGATTGATETAKNEAALTAELKKNLPKARGALDLAVKQLDRDLADVDYILRTPERQMVLGNIEGRLPSFINAFRGGGQNAQNVQSRIDKIKARSVVTHLQEFKASSEQGSSLFGQVTNYENQLTMALAGLDQAQDEATFDRALQEYRNIIVGMRENLPQVFNDTYGRVGSKANISPTPRGGKAGPTTDDIGYLKRNLNRENVAAGFVRNFGMDAFNEAIGRR